MHVKVIPGSSVSVGEPCGYGMTEVGNFERCDKVPFVRVYVEETDADGGCIATTTAMCHEHLARLMALDNHRPFVPERGTREAKVSGTYAIPFTIADPDADEFTLDVDCNVCGQTHAATFRKIDDPHLVRSGDGTFATVTHAADCPNTPGEPIWYGRAPRESDF